MKRTPQPDPAPVRARPAALRWLQRRTAQRGVAIIMVMAVLAGLIALAAPFVMSMILHRRAARSGLDAERARAGAEGAINHALGHLHNLVKAPGYDPTPKVDTLDELKVPMVLPRVNKNFENSNGTLWSARIEDEQGKINLHTAPPSLLGNLFGSALLTETAPRDTPALIVDRADSFYSDGDPKTIDGFVAIGFERRPYCHVQGNQITLAAGQQLDHAYQPGTLAYDARGFYISEYNEGPSRNSWRPFRSIYEIKAISENGRREICIRPDEYARLERFITIDSRMEGPEWGRGEVILGGGRSGGRGFTVENGEGFSPGSKFRIVLKGQTQGYDLVEAVHPAIHNQKQVWHVTTVRNLALDINTPGYQVEPQLHHPVNLNTAPYEVVVACVMGVAPRGSSEAVNRTQAEALAAFLTSGGRVFRDDNDFKAALDDAEKKGILSPSLRDAVYINATESNSPKLRTSTVPFCYRSYGGFTVEGTGIINAQNGVQLARHTLRQTVILPSPPPTEFVLKTQKDFQELVEQGLAVRTLTWPVPMGPNTNANRQSTWLKEADPNEGDIRLDVGESGEHVPRGSGGRGRGQQSGRNGIRPGRGNVVEEWLDHCDDPQHPAFFQEGYQTSGYGPQKLPAAPGGGVAPGTTLTTLPTTGVEMWYKPTGNGQAVFFDQGEAPDRNRVTFSYEPGQGLQIRIYDANLEGKFCEYAYPVVLDSNKWNHVAGSWRSSLYNGQEARVDGQFVPRQGGGQVLFQPGSKLAKDLDIYEDQSLEVEDASQLPDSGAVKVGEEVIEYQAKNGNSLSGLRRGTRLSAGAQHFEGEFVMPFGFTVNFARPLPIGGSTLVEGMEKAKGAASAQTKVVKLATKTEPDYFLDSETGKLTVEDATNFPPSGYVIVQGELIYYSSRSATELRGLKRGLSASNASARARNIRNGASVTLVSFQVSNPKDDYDLHVGHHSQYVQIESGESESQVEWVQYGDMPQMDGKHYFVGLLHNPGGPPVGIHTGKGKLKDPKPPYQWYPNESNEDKPNQQDRAVQLIAMRGALGTSFAQTHDKKAKVVPVVCMSHDWNGGYHGQKAPLVGDQQSFRSQGGSTVSVIIPGSTDGDVRWIKRSFVNQNVHRDRFGRITGFSYTVFMGLNDFTSRRYETQALVLQFPSGELPENLGAQRHVGGSLDGHGQLNGYVDELKVLTMKSRGGRLAMSTAGRGIGAADTTLEVELATAWPADNGLSFNPTWPTTGGLIKIDDEMIVYDSGATSSVSQYSDVRPYIDDYPVADKKRPGKANPDREGKNVYTHGTFRLTGLQRGAFGTDAAPHAPNAGVMLYDAAPITVLSGNMGANDDSLPLKDGTGFPVADGFAWVDDEVISWTKGGGNVRSGCEKFRGRFGTNPANHDAGTLVQALPFRYFDRCAKDHDADGLAYVQTGHVSKDAYWDTVEVKITGGGRAPIPNAVRPRILVRFDGEPGWNVPPTNQEGGIFLYTGAGVHTLKGLMRGQGVRANQIEIRVYYEYTPGAFQPRDDWKQTFAIDEIRATYHNPIDFRRLEQVERR